jgi:hypothetical protein
MAERSASTQIVIGLSATCSAAGKPYVLPVDAPADSGGALLGVSEAADAAGLLVDGLFEQPATTSAMQAAAADTPINLRGALR